MLFFNIIINGLNNLNLNLNDLMVMLSNLEYLQDLVEVPLNYYDINNISFFIEMLFQCQDLSVQFIDGVYVNCIIINNMIYTVHPDLIYLIIKIFRFLKFFFL
jgi:hypothetical protein